jgi:hypothetical protein
VLAECLLTAIGFDGRESDNDYAQAVVGVLWLIEKLNELSALRKAWSE